MEPSEEEIRHRSNVFMRCMGIGLILMPFSLWVYTWLISGLEAIKVSLPAWFSSVLGLAMAFLPLVVLIQFARRRLNRDYPDSRPRRVPEAWERK